jgi:hypothetical protein
MPRHFGRQRGERQSFAQVAEKTAPGKGIAGGGSQIADRFHKQSLPGANIEGEKNHAAIRLCMDRVVSLLNTNPAPADKLPTFE